MWYFGMFCQNFFLHFFICDNLYRIFFDNLQYHVITLHMKGAFTSSPYDWKLTFPRKESREWISVCGIKHEDLARGLLSFWLSVYRLSLPDLACVKVVCWGKIVIQLNSLEMINHLVIFAQASCSILFSWPVGHICQVTTSECANSLWRRFSQLFRPCIGISIPRK